MVNSIPLIKNLPAQVGSTSDQSPDMRQVTRLAPLMENPALHVNDITSSMS